MYRLVLGCKPRKFTVYPISDKRLSDSRLIIIFRVESELISLKVADFLLDNIKKIAFRDLWHSLPITNSKTNINQRLMDIIHPLEYILYKTNR